MKFKKKLHIFISKAHKILGVILLVQILFWALGGIVMSTFPIEEVRSEHKANKPHPINDNVNFGDLLLSIADPAEVNGFRSYAVAGETVISISYKTGDTKVFHAGTKEQLNPFNKEWATKAALADYNDTGFISSVELMTEGNVYYRGKLPVWKVTFQDQDNKVLYINPESGRISARRSTLWRVYDTLWMLHIMDYKTRGDHNNWFLIIASFALFFFCISGGILAFYRVKAKDFKIMGSK